MHKTKLQIISRLWSHVTDLLSVIEGGPAKPVEEIRKEIDLTEYYCRPYADCDDDELLADYVRDVVLRDMRDKKNLQGGKKGGGTA